MRVRVIDYIGNLGGGVRFVAELLKALAAEAPGAEFQLASHGVALERYRQLFAEQGIAAEFLDFPAVGNWRNEPRKLLGIPGSTLLTRRFGFGAAWHFEVPPAALEGCDVAWFPWVHRHRLPEISGSRIVGTFHDAIAFQVPGILTGWVLDDEAETTRRWLVSAARLTVTSFATVETLGKLFGARSERLDVIPLSGEHAASPDAEAPPVEWEWASRPFLLCPANITIHKNHEALLEGLALWGGPYPLVLTGEGTDLSHQSGLEGALVRFGEGCGLLPPSRASQLRRFANSLGLREGGRLVPLGYVPDGVYYGLLPRAWAVVMPTLGEGGGSFPVYEAMLKGVPVLCSDIPVLREQVARMGAEPLWFDPKDPADLTSQLRKLEANYEEHRARAAQTVGSIARRTWRDVATQYWSVLFSLPQH